MGLDSTSTGAVRVDAEGEWVGLLPGEMSLNAPTANRAGARMMVWILDLRTPSEEESALAVLLTVFVLVLSPVAAGADSAVPGNIDEIDAETGKISSHPFGLSFSIIPPPPFPFPSLPKAPTVASHIFGFFAGSTLPRELAKTLGGIYVPFRIASSIMRRWRRRRISDRMTMAPETPRRRTRVARKV